MLPDKAVRYQVTPYTPQITLLPSLPPEAALPLDLWWAPSRMVSSTSTFYVLTGAINHCLIKLSEGLSSKVDPPSTIAATLGAGALPLMACPPHPSGRVGHDSCSSIPLLLWAASFGTINPNKRSKKMGLDMYAMVTNEEPESPVDFKVGAATELHHWRKYPNLCGWMEALYFEKGGAEVFNCTLVILTAADLDRLEVDIRAAALRPTVGFSSVIPTVARPTMTWPSSQRRVRRSPKAIRSTMIPGGKPQRRGARAPRLPSKPRGLSARLRLCRHHFRCRHPLPRCCLCRRPCPSPARSGRAGASGGLS